uniref:Conserved oligomeric Golgi complex subunit 6 n=1 Tax=Salix viminalis TaxID=40686 RepID=A0A6N2M3I9_SALVM
MSFVDLEKPISTSSYYRVARKLRYEAAAAKFLHHQIKQIQETGTGNGDDGGLAPDFLEAEEGAECRTDSPDLVASLNTLSIFYNENTPQSRRNLRSTIEDRSLHLNHEFLQASHTAQQALDRVEEENHPFISLTVVACKYGDIISTTERLKEELEITSQRQDVVSSFLRDYQLSNQEINALRDENLNDNFFKALSHVQQIHANCKFCCVPTISVRFRQSVGNWVTMIILNTVQKSILIAKLNDNSQLLFFFLLVANMRHNALFRRFISALTRGGPGGMPRPIEVHAHDPLRYVGDMLGWLHQALASERTCSAYLTRCSGRYWVNCKPILKSLRMDWKTESDLTFVLDRIFEGVCRPFKVRVEQVLQSQPSLIIACKLSNTGIYSYTVSLPIFVSCCFFVFLMTITVSVIFRSLIYLERYSSVLYTLALRDAAQKTKNPDFDPVISALLDPIIQMCEQAAEAHKSKGVGHASRRRMTSDPGQISKSSVDALLSNNSPATSSKNSESPSKIFLINCLCAIQQPLSRHKVAAGYLKKLGEMIENHMHSLVEKEVEAILSRCGLSQKMHYFQKSLNEEGRTAAGTPLVEIEDTSPLSLSECLRAFFGLILGNESSLPEFELMQVPKLRSEAGVQVARSLAEAYTLIYTAIMDPRNVC